MSNAQQLVNAQKLINTLISESNIALSQINVDGGFFWEMRNGWGLNRREALIVFNVMADTIGGDPATACVFLNSSLGRHLADGMSFITNPDADDIDKVLDAIAQVPTHPQTRKTFAKALELDKLPLKRS